MTLAEIKAEVDRRASIIGATGLSSLPTYGHSRGDGYPYIQVDGPTFHYAVEERGEELSRFTTSDLEELLYRVFADITFSLAMSYEVSHRVRNQDSRRILFRRQVELLGQLSGDWSKRRAQEHEAILRDHPFSDKGLFARRWFSR
jgi:hypothetical protein